MYYNIRVTVNTYDVMEIYGGFCWLQGERNKKY